LATLAIDRTKITSDIVAGLIAAVAAIPDGLADVSETVHEQLERTGIMEIVGAENVLPPKDELVSSWLSAFDLACAWLPEVGSSPRDFNDALERPPSRSDELESSSSGSPKQGGNR
jgi:hypothetical protein